MSTVRLKSPVADGDASVTELTLREPIKALGL